MPIKVRCEHCGKVSEFGDADAGLTALCVACGERFTVPAIARPAVTFVAGDHELPAAHLPPALVRRPVGAGPNRTLLFASLGAALALIVVLGLVLYVVLKPDWERSNSAAVRQLKAQGDALVLQNRLPEAYDTYKKVSDLVGSHSISDPGLRVEVEQARASRDKLFELIFSQARQQFASNTSPGPTTPDNTKPPEQVAVTPPVHMTPDLGITPVPSPVPTPGPIENPGPAPMPVPVPAPATQPAPAPQTQPVKVELPPARPDIAIRTPQDRGVTAPRKEEPKVEDNNAVNPNIRGNRFVRRLKPNLGDSVSDDEIGNAIQNAVNYMLRHFNNGVLNAAGRANQDSYTSGMDALWVLALLQASYAIKDERLNPKGEVMRKMLDELKKLSMEDGPAVYARALRATALALVNRPEDKEAIKADVNYLINGHSAGSYSYTAARATRGGGAGFGDNSNSQYGLLGVWSGAEIGMEVNAAYWQAVESHWTRCQMANGSWGYTAHGGNLARGPQSMTFAGLASLFVTHDYLDAPKMGANVGREPFSAALKKGLDFIEQEGRAVDVDSGYTLYGLERVGLASGFKYFGGHDWYRELGKMVVRSQNADGSWNGRWGTPAETAYHVLFLARGRHPVMMNKLRYDGFWANRPRDLANLARFGSNQLERPLNWQVVPIDRDWVDWTDSPILYISSHQVVNFTDEQLGKIRSFALAGGMIFTQADGGSAAASAGFEQLAGKLFPNYEMKDLPQGHDIYTILYKPTPKPPLRYVSNGARVLMLHSPADIAQAWQMRQDRTKRSIFELGVNIFLYAAGKGDLRNRLTSPYISMQPQAGGGAVKVARLKYAGNWDPEPYAWTRFSRYFQRETDVAADVVTVDTASLVNDPSLVLAHLTGTAAYTFTAQEIAAIKAYVEAGGVLLIDRTGGPGAGSEFMDGVRDMLGKAFPGKEPEILTGEHPIYSGTDLPAARNLSNPIVRPTIKKSTAINRLHFEHIASGKGHVLVSTYDLTHGLLGANTWGIYGFAPEYCCDLMKNVIIWSAKGMGG